MLIRGIDKTFILDMWAEGFTAREIARLLPVHATKSSISKIVSEARQAGDVRAVRRQAANQGFEPREFTRQRLIAMDDAFKAAMLKAIEAGLEQVTISDGEPQYDRSVPYRFTSTGYVASASSIALCSEERAAASDQSRSHARAGA